VIEQKIANLEQEIAEQAAIQKRVEPPPAEAPVPHETTPPARHASPLPWVTLGGGLAVLGLGAAFGVVESGKQRAAIEAPAASDATRDHDSATHFAVAANVSYVVGGVLLVAGAVWALVSWRAHGDGTL
jgi:hypothetical protein